MMVMGSWFLVEKSSESHEVDKDQNTEGATKGAKTRVLMWREL